jgi:hypothetical protein
LGSRQPVLFGHRVHRFDDYLNDSDPLERGPLGCTVLTPRWSGQEGQGQNEDD